MTRTYAIESHPSARRLFVGACHLQGSATVKAADCTGRMPGYAPVCWKLTGLNRERRVRGSTLPAREPAPGSTRWISTTPSRSTISPGLRLRLHAGDGGAGEAEYFSPPNAPGDDPPHAQPAAEEGAEAGRRRRAPGRPASRARRRRCAPAALAEVVPRCSGSRQGYRRHPAVSVNVGGPTAA
jgi:hypothetical protein